MLQTFMHVKGLMQFLAPSRCSVLEEKEQQGNITGSYCSLCLQHPSPRNPLGSFLHFIQTIPHQKGLPRQPYIISLSPRSLLSIPYAAFFFLALITACHICVFVHLFSPIKTGTLLYIHLLSASGTTLDKQLFDE